MLIENKKARRIQQQQPPPPDTHTRNKRTNNLKVEVVEKLRPKLCSMPALTLRVYIIPEFYRVYLVVGVVVVVIVVDVVTCSSSTLSFP